MRILLFKVFDFLFAFLGFVGQFAQRWLQYSVVNLRAINSLPHQLHSFLISMLLLIYLSVNSPCYFAKSVSLRFIVLQGVAFV